MKKIIIIIMFISCVFSLFAASKQNQFKFGFYIPNDSKTGMIFGGTYGSKIDESVDIFASGDFFYRNYVDDKTINVDTSNAGNEIISIKRSSDISTYYIPLMANVRVKFDYNNTQPYIGGGLGWAMAFEDIFIAKDVENNTPLIDDVNFYHGFAGNINAGWLLPLGSRSQFLMEGFYNWSECKRNKEVSSTGITWDQLDMSGFGMRIGLAVRY